MGLKIINTADVCSVVSISSAVAGDVESILTANRLVYNNDAENVIEITGLGFEAKFTEDGVIAMTGADMEWKLNGKDIKLYRAVEVKKGDRLTCGIMKNGYRSYIAAAGGFDIADDALISADDRIKFKIERSQLLGKYKGYADAPELPDGEEESDIRMIVKNGVLKNNGFTVKRTDKRGLYFEETELSAGSVSDINSGLRVKIDGCEFTVLAADLSKLMQTSPRCRVEFDEVSEKDAKFINFKHKMKLAWLDYRLMF